LTGELIHSMGQLVKPDQLVVDPNIIHTYNESNRYQEDERYATTAVKEIARIAYDYDDGFRVIKEFYMRYQLKNGYVDLAVVRGDEIYWIHESKPNEVRHDTNKLLSAYSQVYTGVREALRSNKRIKTILGSLAIGCEVKMFAASIDREARVHIHPGIHFYPTNSAIVLNIAENFKSKFHSDHIGGEGQEGTNNDDLFYDTEHLSDDDEEEEIEAGQESGIQSDDESIQTSDGSEYIDSGNNTDDDC
ncbi:hypothetical protein H4219_006445, partial [Mycoemilia scoparia]